MAPTKSEVFYGVLHNNETSNLLGSDQYSSNIHSLRMSWMKVARNSAKGKDSLRPWRYFTLPTGPVITGLAQVLNGDIEDGMAVPATN